MTLTLLGKIQYIVSAMICVTKKNQKRITELRFWGIPTAPNIDSGMSVIAKDIKAVGEMNTSGGSHFKTVTKRRKRSPALFVQIQLQIQMVYSVPRCYSTGAKLQYKLG